MPDVEGRAEETTTRRTRWESIIVVGVCYLLVLVLVLLAAAACGVGLLLQGHFLLLLAGGQRFVCPTSLSHLLHRLAVVDHIVVSLLLSIFFNFKIYLFQFQI
jgi:hypothetical protein